MLARIFSIILLIVLSPVFVLVSILILLFSGSPILFKHNRCGAKFTEFEIYKFRTMHSNKGPEITNYNDERITRIGQFLRKYKLDELPQLMNILKGDMEFIGPRPEIVRIVKNNPKDFSYLQFIKPGMSDINSIIFKEIRMSDTMGHNEYLQIKRVFSHEIRD